MLTVKIIKQLLRLPIYYIFAQNEAMNNILSKLTLVIIIVFAVILSTNYYPSNILSYDVFGYYLYLPSAFIYKDLGLTDISFINDIIETYKNSSTLYQIDTLDNGARVFKYSMGQAILYLPFFIIGHIIALFTHFPADGFSSPYQMSIFIGSMLYTITGLALIRKFLSYYFSDIITSITILLLFFGSNYLLHTTLHGQNAMSHNYLFTYYALILILTRAWHLKQKSKYLYGLAIVCGLMVLSRPTEIVCLLIPLLWNVDSRDSFKQKIKFLFTDNRKQLIRFSILFISFGIPQFAYWIIFTGKFVYLDYGQNAGEGMDFLWPHLYSVLFSFRKGWYIYTPLMLFATIGFRMLYLNNKKLFTPLFVFFIINLYLVSCWSCWWYAHSFGQRALIQSYAIMVIPLGYFIKWVFEKGFLAKTIFSLSLILIISLNLFQSWQMSVSILDGSRMTSKYYFKTFGKTHIEDNAKQLLLIDRLKEGINIIPNDIDLNYKLLHHNGFEDNKSDNYNSSISYEGSSSFKLDSEARFSPDFSIRDKEITSKEYAWIRGSAMVYYTTDLSNNPCSFIITFEHSGDSYSYRGLDFNKLDLKLNQWNKVVFEYLTPEVRSKRDKLKAYIWYQGSEEIYIDDFKIEAFEPK